MVKFEVYLPGRSEPCDLADLVDFIIAGGATGDDTLSPDYLSFSEEGYEVEAVKD